MRKEAKTLRWTNKKGKKPQHLSSRTETPPSEVKIYSLPGFLTSSQIQAAQLGSQHCHPQGPAACTYLYWHPAGPVQQIPTASVLWPALLSTMGNKIYMPQGYESSQGLEISCCISGPRQCNRVAGTSKRTLKFPSPGTKTETQTSARKFRVRKWASTHSDMVFDYGVWQTLWRMDTLHNQWWLENWT